MQFDCVGGCGWVVLMVFWLSLLAWLYFGCLRRWCDEFSVAWFCLARVRWADCGGMVGVVVEVLVRYGGFSGFVGFAWVSGFLVGLV